MNVDLRIPLGMMFTLMGAVLMAFGLSTANNPEIYARSLGVNLDIWCGVALLVFGLVMVTFGRRGQMKIEAARKKGK
ncbi:MAG TPA: hypothetical protein VGS10_07780 [Terracidiphilus sp.]|nr:hypothetical protein [Terracidiphilus sp.]